MKNMKKMLGFLALGLFAMMFTSCKAKIGGGEFSIFWQILAILMWFIAISQEDYIIPKKQGVFKRICAIFLFILFLAGIIFPFIWAPLPYIPKISLGVAAFIWLIGMIKGAPIKAQKAQKQVEEQAKLEAERKAKEEADKEMEEAKLVEHYNAVMPRVKRYLDSVGFELPPDENVFFMEIDENTGKWKYEVTYDLKVNDWVENSQYSSTWKDDPDLAPYYRCKYKIGKVVKKSPSANGILVTPDGKAYIGAIQGDQTFWWHTEVGKGRDNTFQPVIQNVLAVGNITSQLLCGLHIKAADSKKVPENDQVFSDSYTNNTEDKMYDYYWCSHFPKSVKRVFIFPSDEYEKKNTVTLGGAFNNCSNLRLFYCGFDKCEHEKFLCENSTYKVFADDSHADFISPSKDCLEFFNAEDVCKNWNFKVGTTIQNAVSSAEAEKAEAVALSEALKVDEEAKLAETKAVLEQLEAELAEKKAELATLGMDAQGIVQKAKLNKEIKELEPQIETLKAEVERLGK